MANLIKGVQREQLALFELRIEDMISQDNEVRVIDAFIDSLDLESLGFQKVVANEVGTNHYDDKDLLKLYIYAYRHKARSSRKIEELCKVNVEVIWLLRGIVPNFRTISDFRKEHVKDIKKVFFELIKFAKELDLMGKKVSQDGVKIRAVNSKEKNYTLNKLDDRIERIETSLKRYFEKLDKMDAKEEEDENREEEIEKSKKELEELIKAKEEARKELMTIRQEIENNKESQKSLTDPESRLMKNNGSFQVCYNDQVAVDVESHLVTNYDADNNPADVGTMNDLMEELKKELGIEEPITDITDQGYKDSKDMSKCLENGIIPQVTLGKEEKNYTVTFEYEEEEITEEMQKSKKKEDIKKCLRAGVIPEVYQDFLSDIKLEEKQVYESLEEVANGVEEMSEPEMTTFAMENNCFIRDLKTNKVKCPMGNTLRPKSKHKDGIKYCNKEACKGCKNPCTQAKFKELVMGANQIVSSKDKDLRKKMNPKSKRKRKTKKCITAILTPKKEDIKVRMQTSEHVHGTMKRADDMSYFLLKGKEKVNGELGLYYIGTNLRRMANIMGVTELVEKIKDKIARKSEIYG